MSTFVVFCFKVIVPVLSLVAGMFTGWWVEFFTQGYLIDMIARTGYDTTGLSLWHVTGALGFFSGWFIPHVVNLGDGDDG